MPKRIAMATIGTQGDVQPYVALAVALMRKGYEVVLGAPDDFAELAAAYGVEFRSLGRNIQEFLKQSQFENAMSQNLLVNAPALLREGQRIVDAAARVAWDMSQDADAIMLNMNTSFGIDIAEALEIPVIMAALQPLNSTSEFPFCAYYGPSFGKAFNKLSYTAMGVSQIYYNLPRNRLRRELMGLKTRRIGGLFRDNDGNRLPTLYAYSEHVSPRPHDWPATSVVTGYWQLEDRTGWEPSERFRAWLDAGSQPATAEVKDAPPAHAPLEAPAAESAPAPKPDFAPLDFHIDLPPAGGGSAEPKPDAAAAFKLPDIDLNLDGKSQGASGVAGSRDAHWYDVQAKFDLAKAYE